MHISRLPVLDMYERIIDFAGLHSSVDPDPATNYPTWLRAALFAGSGIRERASTSTMLMKSSVSDARYMCQ